MNVMTIFQHLRLIPHHQLPIVINPINITPIPTATTTRIPQRRHNMQQQIILTITPVD